MSLFVQDWNGFLIVPATGKSNHFTNGFVGLKKCAVLRNSAFMKESLGSLYLVAVVVDDQCQTRNQIRSLAGSRINLLKFEFGIFQEDLFITPPFDASAGYFVRNLADNAQSRGRHKRCSWTIPIEDASNSALERHPIDLAVSIHFNIQTRGQSINY